MTPQSVRLSDDVLRRLTDLAGRRGSSVSSTIERLLDDALRREAHPGITFRDGSTGRRAGLVAGPDVDEVLRTVRAVQEEGSADVVAEVAETTSLTESQVRGRRPPRRSPR
ncbi:ribbon-helix-helix protein, CopG family [Geodermatophilus sp. TF02-6]|uniref:ribbon-helix-helix protein, CopG family n=1 Tax=Geodermatophilus sp. TF02-6 TaxID=2250575 RepID=UPI001F254792|nr:ribbon-helix-helix protein, CopG family [Geodermatophilus sp. TF02-6]